MSKMFWDAVKGRRTVYSLGSEQIVPESRVEEIARDTVKHVPSAFNSQSTRLLLLFGEQHKRLWQITLDALKKVTPADRFPETEKKVNGSFASGYGTVLFFEEETVIKKLQSQFSIYSDHFPTWAQHTNAIHQFVIWTALEAEGLGASLQHYNSLIDEAVKREWNIPDSWQLVAQMPFGKPLAPAGEKEFTDLETRIKIYH